MSVVRAAIVLGLVLTAGKAYGQVPSPAHHIGKGQFAYDGRSPIEVLTQHQKSGDWDKLHKYALELLGDLAEGDGTKDLFKDIKRNYFSFVWQSDGPDGKPVIYRVLVHDGLTPQRATRLPGLELKWPAPSGAELTALRPPTPKSETATDGRGPELFDVLIADSPEASLTSVYIFTPTPDPLATQLPDFVSKLNALGYLAKAAGTGDATTSVLVYVNQPDLLMRRAKIQIKDVISTRITAAVLKNDAVKTCDAVLLHQARTSACAQKLAKDLRDGMVAVADSAACQEGGEICAAALKAKIKDVYANVVGACQPEPGHGLGFDPVIATEQEFSKLVVAGGARVVTGESALVNAPDTRFSYGLMTGVLVGNVTFRGDRVKVDGGKIAAAPLERLLTMAVVNVHPWAYDGEWPKVGWAERFRIFGGGVITPDVGLTGGIGFGIVRGLTFNVGGVWLFTETPKTDERIGEAPVNTRDPFKRGRASGAFIGLSFVFK